MTRFLSEETILAHKEYLKGLKGRYAYYTEAIPELSGSDPKVFKKKMRLPLDIISLYGEIRLHECYFSSFSNPLPAISYISARERALLNEIFEAALSINHGFVTLSRERRGIAVNKTEDFCDYDAILSLDVSEHAYLFDYGFDKKRYLEAALYYLDLQRL